MWNDSRWTDNSLVINEGPHSRRLRVLKQSSERQRHSFWLFVCDVFTNVF